MLPASNIGNIVTLNMMEYNPPNISKQSGVTLGPFSDNPYPNIKQTCADKRLHRIRSGQFLMNHETIKNQIAIGIKSNITKVSGLNSLIKGLWITLFMKRVT